MLLRPVPERATGGTTYKLTPGRRAIHDDANSFVGALDDSPMGVFAPRSRTVDARFLPTTLYYVRPRQSLVDKAGTPMPTVEAFSLVVPGLTRSGVLWAFGGLSLRAESDDNNKTFALTLHGASPNAAVIAAPRLAAVPSGATCMLTYSTNLVSLAAVAFGTGGGGGRIMGRRFAGMTVLNVSSVASRSSSTGNTLGESLAGVQPPLPLFPLCVASPLDVVAAMGRVTVLV